MYGKQRVHPFGDAAYFQGVGDVTDPVNSVRCFDTTGLKAAIKHLFHCNYLKQLRFTSYLCNSFSTSTSRSGNIRWYIPTRERNL